MKKSVNSVLSIVGAILISVAFASPAFAQESSAPTPAPAGIGVLIFLLGIAAIGFVGFSYLSQNRAAHEDKTEYNEDDEE